MRIILLRKQDNRLRILIHCLLCMLFVVLVTGCTLKEGSRIDDNYRYAEYPYTTTLENNELSSGTLQVWELADNLEAAVAHQPAAPLRVSQWQTVLGSKIVVNGGYHNQDFSPSGFVQIDGVAESTRSFDYDRSGFVAINRGDLSLVDPSEPGFAVENYTDLLQSFPYLIKDGLGVVSEDSGLRARRTLLAESADGTDYIIIADQSNLSLFQTMKEVLKMPYQFENVLNLDGGPSTGITLKIEDQELLQDSWLPVPSVIYWD